MVEGKEPRPPQRNVKGFNNVRPQPILIVRRIVAELHENLSLEAVPIAVEQRVTQRLWLGFKLEDIILRDKRVFCGQRRDVLRADYLFFVQCLAVNPLFLYAHVRTSVHKHLFHPAVPDVAGVAGRADNRHNAQGLLCAQAGFYEVIDRLFKAGQFVEV